MEIFAYFYYVIKIKTMKNKMKKQLTIAEKECVLLMNNYTANPIMEVMFGEKCYNWRNPKSPTTITMSDVAKTIRLSEIEDINDESTLHKFIKSKLK